jgi:hypothetical protein
LATLRFIIDEQKAQLDGEKRVLERRRAEADASSQRRTNLSSYYSSGATQRPSHRNSPRGDRHHLAQNIEDEFNEADIVPKTRDAAIMATTTYIAANAPNNDEHMSKLRDLALECVRVLQMANEPTQDPMPRKIQQPRHQPVALAVSPRPHIVEAINGELRHGLTQHRVDTARAQCEARLFNDHDKGE